MFLFFVGILMIVSGSEILYAGVDLGHISGGRHENEGQ